MTDELIGIVRRCLCCNQWHSIDNYPPRSKVCNRCRKRIASEEETPAA